MNIRISILLMVLFISCKTNYSASELVLKEINTSEKILTKNPEKPLVSNFIENLSAIECTEKEELYHQYSCIVTMDVINQWKKWYEINKDNFYFNPQSKCLELLPLKEKEKKKVVFLKTKDGVIRSSLTYDQIWTCEELSKINKKN